ncbi:uncharacterized protein LOC124300993 [Neodiprion virginianus]|uniref:uncharacterized protein LOC124300993 n=1 Tax=Neodiprion virginianus TaxID=2961670 RepID=UPI001EE72244|nr:uncharacterized protein LOC124300993 [Neodiprion virginianus]
MLKPFMEKTTHKIRELASLLGTLNAATPAVAYSLTYCKRLERKKFLALIASDIDYEGKVTINERVREDLVWWKTNVSKGFSKIRTKKFALEISSDASLTGWGAHSENRSTHGFWEKSHEKYSINYLELLAASYALQCFASNLSDCEILLRIDNTTAVSYINRAGGIQLPHLSELARNIWEWCESRQIWVFASYIPSGENVEADRASRIKNIDTEWEISNKFFSKIESKFGPFSIDLFASNANKKCERFCSRFPQPNTKAVDAFTIPWSDKEGLYAFPPFSLVLKTLRKIIIEKAECTIIVTHWPSQAWYPLFVELQVSDSLILPPKIGMLLSPCRKKTHPLAARLSLEAANISGKLFRKED